MDEYSLTALGIILAGSFPCGVLGYLIAVKQKRNLISGWDESRVRDPHAFAKLVGWSLIVMALLLAVVAAVWGGRLLSETAFLVCLIVVSLVPVLALFVAKAKYGS